MNDIDFEELGARMSEDTLCAQCGTRFEPGRRWARFCSPTCRSNWHVEHAPVEGIVDSVVEGKLSTMVVISVPKKHSNWRAKFKAGMAVKVSR